MKNQNSIVMNLFRSLMVIMLIVVISSCSSDNGPNFQSEFRPIDSIAIPDTVSFNKDYDFKVYYEVQGDCDEFGGFNIQKDMSEEAEDNSYVVAAIVNVYDREECEQFEDPKIESDKFLFRADEKDPYIFKFLQGVDKDDKPLYLEKTVYIEGAADTTAAQ